MRPEGPVVPFDESKDQRNVRPFRPQVLLLHRFPGPQGPGWVNYWPTWAARPEPPVFLKNTPYWPTWHWYRRHVPQEPSSLRVKISRSQSQPRMLIVGYIATESTDDLIVELQIRVPHHDSIVFAMNEAAQSASKRLPRTSRSTLPDLRQRVLHLTRIDRDCSMSG